MNLNVRDFNFWAKDHILNENHFDEEGTFIDKNAFKNRPHNYIVDILIDHWENYYNKNKDTIDKYRPNANDEIRKAIKCHNHEFGASVHLCNDCMEVFLCHNTCKSRFCSSCGMRYQRQIANNILNHCYQVKHRQMIFTVPEQISKLFLKDLHALGILHDAVCETIYSVVNGKPKKQKYPNYKWMPGFFAFLHTFGRPLNLNTHIHVIIAEMVIGKDKVYKKFNYFNYEALRKRFQYILLNKLVAHFGKEVVNPSYYYNNSKNGFFVGAEPKAFKSLEDSVLYAARYCSRPAIGLKRILNYNGQNVTYCYNAHEDNKYHEVTVSAHQFITLLIKHLLPKNFKAIRYYGFYNKNHKFHDKIVMLISNEQAKLRTSFLKWKFLILTSFNRNPLECPSCGKTMTFQFVFT